jgi:hypothetical protein
MAKARDFDDMLAEEDRDLDYVEVEFDEDEELEGTAYDNYVDPELPFDPEKDKEKIDEIMSWLTTEFEKTQSQRARKYESLRRYRRARAGEKSMESKEYPYPNSSNVSVPMSLIMAQGTFGALKGTFSQKIPFWSIKSQAKDEEMHKRATVLEKYYRIISESQFDLDLRKKNRTILYEGGSLGTCMVKVSWLDKDWFFKRVENGAKREVTSFLHSGPAVIPLPYEHAIYPEGQESIQDLPWFAQKIPLQKHEIEARKTQGVYDNLDKVLANPRTEPTDEERDRAASGDKDFDQTEKYDLYEFYFYYDSDGDGKPSDIIFTIHMDSHTLVKQQYNNLGWRPFIPFNYFHVPYSVEGRGTCQTVDTLQEEVDGVHNVRNDNMKLANMRMLAVKRTGKMNTKERMRPGKIWWLENPKNDINVVQLGEVYPSSVQEENMLWSYAEKACAMPSIKMGFADQTLKSRDTWHGMQTRLGQNDGLFESIKEGLEEAYANMGMLLFFILVDHREEVIAKERSIGRLTEDEVNLLEDILSMRIDDVPQKLAFNINTSDLQDTWAAKQQNLVMLANISNMTQQQLMPLAQILLGPQGQQMMQQSPRLFQYMNDTFVNNWKTLEKVYEFAGFQDTENYIPTLDREKQLQKMLRDMQKNMMRAQGAISDIPEEDNNVGFADGSAGGGSPSGGGLQQYGSAVAGGGGSGVGNVGGGASGATGPSGFGSGTG